jgi:hypothetical protein
MIQASVVFRLFNLTFGTENFMLGFIAHADEESGSRD